MRPLLPPRAFLCPGSTLAQGTFVTILLLSGAVLTSRETAGTTAILGPP